MRRIQCESCTIRRTGVIADLPDDQLGAFHACSMTAIYKSRQVIFHEGAPTSGLFILCQGAVKLYQSDRFGRDHILGVAGAGDILGELPADSQEPYSTSAEALTDSQLCYLPRERLARFVEQYPTAAVRLVAALSKSLNAARKKVRALALKTAEARLAELLIQLADVSNGNGHGRTRLTLRYSRRELAEMIGVSTETAIRLLGRLKRKRAISTSQRELMIADAEKLGRIANHDAAGAF